MNDVLKQLPAEAQAELEHFAFMGDLWGEMRKTKQRADEPLALAGRWARPNMPNTIEKVHALLCPRIEVFASGGCGSMPKMSPR